MDETQPQQPLETPCLQCDCTNDYDLKIVQEQTKSNQLTLIGAVIMVFMVALAALLLNASNHQRAKDKEQAALAQEKQEHDAVLAQQELALKYSLERFKQCVELGMKSPVNAQIKCNN